MHSNKCYYHSYIVGSATKNHIDDDIESNSPQIHRTARDDHILITVLPIALGGALVTALILLLVRYNLSMLQKALYITLSDSKDVENGGFTIFSHSHKENYDCLSVDTITITISDDDSQII